MTVEHTGEWGPEFVMSWSVMDTWEVKTDGEHTITHIVSIPFPPMVCQSRIRTPNGETTGPRDSESITEISEYLTSGQIVEFLAYEGAANGQVSGTWTVMEPAPLPENAITPDQIDGVYVGAQLADALYRGDTLVWPAQHALIKSEPDYWYSMENGAHHYNRGALDTPMRFDGGGFSNRGDHAYTSGNRGTIRVEDSWAGGFSFAGWFEIMARDSTAYFFVRGPDPSASDTRRVFVISTSPTHGSCPNGIGFRIDPTGSDLTAWAYSPSNIIPESGWFHLAITWDIDREGYPNWASIYVDGVYSGGVRWSSSVPPISFTPNELVSVADSFSTTSHRLHANIDDVAIWNRTLEPGEVADIYRDGPVPTAELFELYTSSGVNSTLGSGIKHTWTVPHDDMWFLYTYAWAESTVTANISIRDDSGNTLMSKAHDSGSSDEFRIAEGDAVYLTEGTVVTWHSNISGSSPRDLHWHINQGPMPPGVQFIRHPVNFTNTMPSSGAWREINSIRVVGSGMTNIYSTFRFDGLSGIGSQNRGVRILLNGSVLDSNTSTGLTSWSSSLDILDVQVSHGDVITMQGRSTSNNSRRRNITSNVLAVMP